MTVRIHGTHGGEDLPRRKVWLALACVCGVVVGAAWLDQLRMNSLVSD
jgi:hypothetical protein